MLLFHHVTILQRHLGTGLDDRILASTPPAARPLCQTTRNWGWLCFYHNYSPCAVKAVDKHVSISSGGPRRKGQNIDFVAWSTCVSWKWVEGMRGGKRLDKKSCKMKEKDVIPGFCRSQTVHKKNQVLRQRGQMCFKMPLFFTWSCQSCGAYVYQTNLQLWLSALTAW